MQRVMIIGCCGAGKSTLARKLHQLTDLELIHLDQHYWKPNWTETSTDEWEGIVTRLANKPEWIIDGNYGGTFDIRLAKADTIIYLDVPTWKCLWRITSRVIKYWRQVRPDMPEGCRERFDFEFFHYVATFNIRKRKKMMEKLAMQSKSTAIFVLSTDYQVEEFLNSISE